MGTTDLYSEQDGVVIKVGVVGYYINRNILAQRPMKNKTRPPASAKQNLGIQPAKNKKGKIKLGDHRMKTKPRHMTGAK